MPQDPCSKSFRGSSLHVSVWLFDISRACVQNDIKMAKLLLNGSYDPEKDTDPYGDVRRSNFKKTSAVDLTHQDIYGWTALHHVVAPLPDCTYTCPAMLHLLAHVGAPLDTPDLNGVTPLHLAAARGVASLTLALQVGCSRRPVSRWSVICVQAAYSPIRAVCDQAVCSLYPDKE